MSIVVAGVGQLFQGDLDVGRHVAQRLASSDLRPDIVVEDFYYGAVAVMQRLQDLEPRALVLVGAERFGAAPGTVRRRRLRVRPSATWEIQDAVGAAATGHVAITLIAEVAAGFGALPRRSAAIEIEPAVTDPRDELTPAVAEAVPRACAQARREVLRIGVLEQADRVAAMLRASARPAPAAGRPEVELLSALTRLDDDGDWGDTAAVAARVRSALAPEPAPPGAPGDAAMRQAVVALLDGIEQTRSAEAALDTG